MKVSQETLNRLINNSITAKQNKYHNKKVIVDNIKFDSKKEARRYNELKLLEKAGIIKNLQRQVKYELQTSFKYNGKTIRAINYIADFVYEKDGELIVEDVKGIKTDIYKLKKKMLLYIFNIEIQEF